MDLIAGVKAVSSQDCFPPVRKRSKRDSIDIRVSAPYSGAFRRARRVSSRSMRAWSKLLIPLCPWIIRPGTYIGYDGWGDTALWGEPP
jgi:hypothetical protein